MARVAYTKIPDSALVDPIWERQPGEMAVAYAAFRAYRDLGEGRTIAKAIDVLLTSWPDIPGRDSRSRLSRSSYENRASHWSSDNRWVERSSAWDANIDRIRLDAEEKGRQEMARHYEARVQTIRDREYAIGIAAMDGILTLLQQPVLGEVRTQDGKTIHIHPNKEITRVLPALLREASRSARLAIDLPTEGARMPNPEPDNKADSDVDTFLKALGSGGESSPSASLPDPETSS